MNRSNKPLYQVAEDHIRGLIDTGQLVPGDLICCGTSVGARTMKPGSEIHISIPGIGTLVNHFDDYPE